MDRSIEVRTLAGESTTVSIPRDSSISTLKASLKQSFPPASNSQNFHLFCKGNRLKLDTRVDDCINAGEFIVLVPFAQKPRQTPENITETFPASAGSAWSESDLRYLINLSETSRHNAAQNNVIHKRKRGFDEGGVLTDILCSGSEDVFDERVRGVVESASCLCDSEKGCCLLREELSSGMDGCVCPSWLKRVLKSFMFLNVFHGFLQAREQRMTAGRVEEVFKKGRCVGLDDGVGMSDVEMLTILCPKVVMLIKQENIVCKQGSAIIIYSSSEAGVEHDSTIKYKSARKPAATSSIINSITNRNYAFRIILWKVIKGSMQKVKTCAPLPSLEDIMTYLNRGIASEKGSKNKSVRTRSSVSRCCGTDQMEPNEMIEHLRKGVGMHGQLVHVEEIPPKLAVYAEFPPVLSEASESALKEIGISRLYSHQAEAIEASLSGKNVTVSTSTSSGKSLCYNLPVLETLSQNRLSCAVYIFPTKALAQDQLRALLQITRCLNIDLNIGIYDGDTPQEHRSWIRDNARLLITNPDMLHMSILPYHGQFQRILSNLRFIVIDEAHTYKGAFGCHTSFIFRRLSRICSHVYGSNPSFIFSTATSANPREHAMELANLQTLELIQKDGSPSGPKYFLLWNPPLRPEPKKSSRNGHISEVGGFTRRSSPILEVSYLFAEIVQHGLRCITFCKTRKLTELVLIYTREILQETAPDLVDCICVYRGGYTPKDRRRIEADFFGGKLRGVAATNALELGVDVGHIDATLHLGFPGSVASLWQQAGRSGRRSKPSLAIYVAFEGPLDQYFMRFPHKLFQRSIEHCHADAQNHKVLQQHLTCAAFELPLSLQYDEKYFGSSLDSAIATLKNKGYLGGGPRVPSTKLWSYIGPEKMPSRVVSIRAIENEKYKVVDKTSNKVLEEIEESRAFFQVYEGAVYMNQGVTYLVKDLNLSEKIAICEKADLKYYTKTRDYTDVHVVGGDIAYALVNPSHIESVRTTAQTNDCKVTTKWFGFYRIWTASNQIFDKAELALPAYSYESQATWIRVPQSIKATVDIHELSFRAGLHAASHALLNVVPLYIMCNTSDLSTECTNPHETRDIPERLLIYDTHPGGIGISAQVQLLFRELLTAAMELVSACSCLSATGCPNCVQSLTCSEYNEVLDKKAASLILKGVIEAENVYFETRP